MARYTTPSDSSATARPPSALTQWAPRNMIFCFGSLSRDWASTGRRCSWSAPSAMRADRLEERTAEKVATASTKVPAAVARDATVAVSSPPITAPFLHRLLAHGTLRAVNCGLALHRPQMTPSARRVPSITSRSTTKHVKLGGDIAGSGVMSATLSRVLTNSCPVSGVARFVEALAL